MSLTSFIPFVPIAFHVPPTSPAAPGFIVQVTPLTIPSGSTPGSLMIWVGVGDGAPVSDDGRGDTEEKNEYERALEEETGGADGAADGYLGGRRLGADWACAMPSRLPAEPVASTTLLASSTLSPSPSSTPINRSELIARRLSRKVNCQIFLSLDLEVQGMFGQTSGGGGQDAGLTGASEAVVGRIVLGLEKGLGQALGQLLALSA